MLPDDSMRHSVELLTSYTPTRHKPAPDTPHPPVNTHPTPAPSSSTFAAAVESNLVERIAHVARWPRVELHDDPDRLWITSDVESTLFNQIARTRFPDGTNVDDEIDQALARYTARGLTGFWWTGPGDQPADLGPRLEAKGVNRGSLPGMAAGLATLDFDHPSPAGLAILPCSDRDSLSLWTTAIATAWELTPSFLPLFAEACAAQALGAGARWLPYVALLHGAPVGTASVFYGTATPAATPTAGLYYVWTDPRVRGRGIATALTLISLRDAHHRGARIATLFSSHAAVRLYRRLGFAEYCTIGQCVFGLPPKPLVRQMQLDLERLGYDAGGADGIYGQKTVHAVMAFRKDHGLPGDWRLDSPLRSALDKALSARQSPP